MTLLSSPLREIKLQVYKSSFVNFKTLTMNKTYVRAHSTPDGIILKFDPIFAH